MAKRSPNNETHQDDEPTVDPWAVEHLPVMRDRLAAVGATPGEIEEFAAQWLDPEWNDHDEKVRLLALGDLRLREEVESARADGQRDTTTEDEEAAQNDADAEAARLAAVRAEAETMSEFDPDEILEWAGDDHERLVAVLDVEESHPEPRDDLVELVRTALG